MLLLVLLAFAELRRFVDRQESVVQEFVELESAVRESAVRGFVVQEFALQESVAQEFVEQEFAEQESVGREFALPPESAVLPVSVERQASAELLGFAVLPKSMLDAFEL